MRLEDTTAFQQLNGRDPDWLTMAKTDTVIKGADGQSHGRRHTYICPACGNGSGAHGTGMAVHDCGGHERWHCFGCNYDRDLIGLYADHTGESDRLKAFRELCGFYGIQVDADWHGGQKRQDDDAADLGDGKPGACGNMSGQEHHHGNGTGDHSTTASGAKLHTSRVKDSAAAPAPDFTPYYDECAARIDQQSYLQSRGISIPTAKRCGVGYDPHCTKVPYVNGRPAVIFPASKSVMSARVCDLKLDSHQGGRKCGSPDVSFNLQALRDAAGDAASGGIGAVWITEGEIDALSMEEIGRHAVGLKGANRAAAFLQELITSRIRVPCVIATDDDDAGEKAAAVLAEGLAKLGVPFISLAKGWSLGRKDPNGMLTADREALQKLATETEARMPAVIEQVKAEQERQEAMRQADEAAKADAEKRRQEEEQRKAAEKFEQDRAEWLDKTDIRQLYEASRDDRTPRIATGFKLLDEVLDGGLKPGSLYTIGAISSLGKTTFALQMADHIASQGHDVLIFSLEMSRNELISKSVSRMAARIQQAADRPPEHFVELTATACAEWSNRQTFIRKEAKRQNRNPDDVASEINDLIRRAEARYWREVAPHIWILESDGSTDVDTIRMYVHDHIAYTGHAPVVIIDYLQIMHPATDPEHPNQSKTDKQNTDYNVSELKRICRGGKETPKVPIITISSVNRINYEARISMAALKESGSIEFSSDVIIGLQLTGAGTKGFNAELKKKQHPRAVDGIILKNRLGEIKGIHYSYFTRMNQFREDNYMTDDESFKFPIGGGDKKPDNDAAKLIKTFMAALKKMSAGG